MDRAYISWNIPNLISVALMAGLAWLVFGAIVQASKKYVNNASASTQAQTDDAVLSNA